LDRKMATFDTARDHLLPKQGATSDTIDRAAIEAMPQGDNAPLDRMVLAFPGVNTDSAASGQNFHVRSEYSNVQTRINGLVLPDSVSSLGPMIDTNFIGSISLLTGTLPAQYGGRTAGVLDITSRAFSTPGGSIGVYGGSHQTITPSFDYGGSSGDTQYFFAGRGNWNGLGLENPASSIDALHDHTDQGKFFAYVSTLLSDSARLSIMSGAAYSHYQIPNNPNQTPLGNFGPLNYNSSSLDETQQDRYQFNMVALQTKGETVDTQLSVFQRWAQIHFIPDVFGDLVFNDVASDVTRSSEVYGSQFDASWQVNSAHTLRAGYLISAEKTNVSDIAAVLPDGGGAPLAITDTNSLLGWTIGTYLQDEWKLTRQLTFNFGLRFDQLYQYVDANQFSPRAAFVYKPFDGTGAAGTVTLLRCRHRPEARPRPRGRARRVLQDRHRPARRRPVRPDHAGHAVQLRPRLQRRHRGQVQIHPGRFHRARQPRLQHHPGDRPGLQPVPVQ
ncbi:MAG: TonB-dependent receptor domain-containing protein, partial [Xanthobacteraceae bacterium]